MTQRIKEHRQCSSLGHCSGVGSVPDLGALHPRHMEVPSLGVESEL